MVHSPTLFFVLFVLAFFYSQHLFMRAMFARYSGWKKLAERYATDKDLGDRLIRTTGAMGSATYWKSLLVSADIQGLYLSLGFFYRASHPPLFIPWQEVKVTSQVSRGRERVFFLFEGNPRTLLRLPKEVVIQLKALAGNPAALEKIDDVVHTFERSA